MNARYANLQCFKNPLGEILGGGAERQRRRTHSVFHDDGSDFGFAGARFVIDEGMVKLRQHSLFADVLHFLEIHHHVRAVVLRLTDAYVHTVCVPMQVLAQSVVVRKNMSGIELHRFRYGQHVILRLKLPKERWSTGFAMLHFFFDCGFRQRLLLSRSGALGILALGVFARILYVAALAGILLALGLCVSLAFLAGGVLARRILAGGLSGSRCSLLLGNEIREAGRLDLCSLAESIKIGTHRLL